MKQYACAIALFALLAGGCAHGPGRAPSTDPSLSALPPQSGQVGSSPEQKPVTTPEKSSGPDKVGGEGNGKPDARQDQAGGKDENLGDYTGEEEKAITISDPIEPFNRAMFQFNDKVYFWALKPVSQGYGKVVPEFARVGVQNFFYNIRFPARFVSCLLQADLKSSAQEIGRFSINTVLGMAGLVDVASDKDIDIPKHEVDLGQTLGVYGVGHGFYIVWPFLGSSSARDSVEIAGDLYLDPVSYIPPWYAATGVRTYEVVNYTSLSIGDYESLKEAAMDPYQAVRDAYAQHRQKLIEKGGTKNGQTVPAGAHPVDAGALQ